MKATHIDYLHPGHLRVEDGKSYPAFSIARGDFMRHALCVAPGSDLYRRLWRSGLPKYRGEGAA